MNHKLFTTLSSLSISSALLAVGLMANGEATRLSGSVDGSPLVESVETGAVQATEEVVIPVERKHRRGRSSLSMPYFSFAQSMRPRG
jgi:hypothetical protein